MVIFPGKYTDEVNSSHFNRKKISRDCPVDLDLSSAYMVKFVDY